MATDTIANRYKVLRVLGEGAMGQICLVEDATDARHVALKVIGAGLGVSEKSILQLKQEFRLMTQLRHPNCCAVYDYGVTAEGAPYFTMEVVPGHGLNELPALPDARVREVLTQLLLALAHLHGLGFVHRDLKPANVRLLPDGSLKLMDFGLMGYARGAGGAIAGTLGYLAPEVAQRGPVDQRADLYSLGCLAYELLAGRLPFVRKTPVEVVRAHVYEFPEPPSAFRPGLDPALEAVVMRLLAKDPLDRFQDAAEALEALGAAVPAGIGGALLSAPLVGRDALLGELTARLAALGQGVGEALLLSGPAGMGKTRLVQAIKAVAQMADLPCVAGANFDADRTPFGPFGAVVRGLLPVLRAADPLALARLAPVLGALVAGPELGPDVVPAPALDSPQKEKLRLYAAVAAAIAAAARPHGLLLVLDDWQWADPASTELLAYLLRNLAAAPVLVIVATRGAAGLDGARSVPLAPLDEEAVRRMVASMLGSDRLDPEFVRAIADASGGAPAYVERLLEHLVKAGTLARRGGRWDTAIALTGVDLPRNRAVLLGAELAALGADARAIAHAAAVIGREFALELLQAACALEDEAMFAAMEAMTRRRLLVRGEDGAYRFATEELPELIYSQLDAAERLRLHGRVADALAARPGALDSLGAVTTLANHLLRADDRPRTIRYALAAGLGGARLHANEDAKRFLSLGLALLREDPQGLDAERLAFLRALGDVLRFGGELEPARLAYDEGIALARARGERGGLGHMLTSLAKVQQMQGDLKAALATAADALAAVLAEGDAAGAARCMVSTARLMFFDGHVADAVAASKQALDHARAAGDPQLVGASQAFLGYLYATAQPEHRALGMVQLAEAIACQEAADDKAALLDPLNYLGNAQTIVGDFLPAKANFARMHAVAFEIGAKDEEIFALLNLAICNMELGGFADALAAAGQAAAQATRLRSSFPLGAAIALEASALTALGRLAGVPARFDRALDLAAAIQNRYLEVMILPYHVDALGQLGRAGEALAVGARLTRAIQETGMRESEHLLAVMLAEAHARLGQGEMAGELLETALRGAEAVGARGIRARALVAKARLALAAERWDDARRIAAEALALATAIGAWPLVAEAHGVLGERALALGAGDAVASYAAMAAVARTMGTPVWGAEALFGQAAALPHAAGARELASRALGLIEGVLAPLDATDRAAFLSYAERARVVGGDFAAFGRRRVARVAPILRFGRGFGTGQPLN